MAYILILRNDIPDGVLQVLDLLPNSSQVAGNPVNTTPETGVSRYVSDSSNNRVFDSDRATEDCAALAAADSDGDLANDCFVTVAAQTGLSAYLQERIHSGGVADAAEDTLSVADANTATAAIVAIVNAGTALNKAAVEGTLPANTDLDGDDGGGLSLSFGTVADVLRILAGDPYTVAADTIITDATPTFLAEAARDVLVAAQAIGEDFSSTGSFSQEIKASADTVSTALSARSGQLASLKAATFSYLDTAGAAVAIYDDDGEVL